MWLHILLITLLLPPFLDFAAAHPTTHLHHRYRPWRLSPLRTRTWATAVSTRSRPAPWIMPFRPPYHKVSVFLDQAAEDTMNSMKKNFYRFVDHPRRKDTIFPQKFPQASLQSPGHRFPQTSTKWIYTSGNAARPIFSPSKQPSPTTPQTKITSSPWALTPFFGMSVFGPPTVSKDYASTSSPIPTTHGAVPSTTRRHYSQAPSTPENAFGLASGVDPIHDSAHESTVHVSKTNYVTPSSTKTVDSIDQGTGVVVLNITSPGPNMGDGLKIVFEIPEVDLDQERDSISDSVEVNQHADQSKFDATSATGYITGKNFTDKRLSTASTETTVEEETTPLTDDSTVLDLPKKPSESDYSYTGGSATTVSYPSVALDGVVSANTAQEHPSRTVLGTTGYSDFDDTTEVGASTPGPQDGSNTIGGIEDVSDYGFTVTSVGLPKVSTAVPFNMGVTFSETQQAEIALESFTMSTFDQITHTNDALFTPKPPVSGEVIHSNDDTAIITFPENSVHYTHLFAPNRPSYYDPLDDGTETEPTTVESPSLGTHQFEIYETVTTGPYSTHDEANQVQTDSSTESNVASEMGTSPQTATIASLTWQPDIDTSSTVDDVVSVVKYSEEQTTSHNFTTEIFYSPTTIFEDEERTDHSVTTPDDSLDSVVTTAHIKGKIDDIMIPAASGATEHTIVATVGMSEVPPMPTVLAVESDQVAITELPSSQNVAVNTEENVLDTIEIELSRKGGDGKGPDYSTEGDLELVTVKHKSSYAVTDDTNDSVSTFEQSSDGKGGQSLASHWTDTTVSMESSTYFSTEGSTLQGTGYYDNIKANTEGIFWMKNAAPIITEIPDSTTQTYRDSTQPNSGLAAVGEPRPESDISESYTGGSSQFIVPDSTAVSETTLKKNDWALETSHVDNTVAVALSQGEEEKNYTWNHQSTTPEIGYQTSPDVTYSTLVEDVFLSPETSTTYPVVTDKYTYTSDTFQTGDESSTVPTTNGGNYLETVSEETNFFTGDEISFTTETEMKYSFSPVSNGAPEPEIIVNVPSSIETTTASSDDTDSYATAVTVTRNTEEYSTVHDSFRPKHSGTYTSSDGIVATVTESSQEEVYTSSENITENVAQVSEQELQTYSSAAIGTTVAPTNQESQTQDTFGNTVLPGTIDDVTESVGHDAPAFEAVTYYFNSNEQSPTPERATKAPFILVGPDSSLSITTFEDSSVYDITTASTEPSTESVPYLHYITELSPKVGVPAGLQFAVEREVDPSSADNVESASALDLVTDERIFQEATERTVQPYDRTITVPSTLIPASFSGEWIAAVNPWTTTPSAEQEEQFTVDIEYPSSYPDQAGHESSLEVSTVSSLVTVHDYEGSIPDTLTTEWVPPSSGIPEVTAQTTLSTPTTTDFVDETTLYALSPRPYSVDDLDTENGDDRVESGLTEQQMAYNSSVQEAEKDFNYYDGMAFEDPNFPDVDFGQSLDPPRDVEYTDRQDYAEQESRASPEGESDQALAPEVPEAISIPPLRDTKGLEIQSLVSTLWNPDKTDSSRHRSDIPIEDDDPTSLGLEIFEGRGNAVGASGEGNPVASLEDEFPFPTPKTLESRMLKRMIPLVVKHIRQASLSEEDSTKLSKIFGPLWPGIVKFSKDPVRHRSKRSLEGKEVRMRPQLRRHHHHRRPRPGLRPLPRWGRPRRPRTATLRLRRRCKNLRDHRKKHSSAGGLVPKQKANESHETFKYHRVLKNLNNASTAKPRKRVRLNDKPSSKPQTKPRSKTTIAILSKKRRRSHRKWLKSHHDAPQAPNQRRRTEDSAREAFYVNSANVGSAYGNGPGATSVRSSSSGPLRPRRSVALSSADPGTEDYEYFEEYAADDGEYYEADVEEEEEDGAGEDDVDAGPEEDDTVVEDVRILDDGNSSVMELFNRAMEASAAGDDPRDEDDRDEEYEEVPIDEEYEYS